MRRALDTLYLLAGPMGFYHALTISPYLGRKLGRLILTHARTS